MDLRNANGSLAVATCYSSLKIQLLSRGSLSNSTTEFTVWDGRYDAEVYKYRL